MENNVILSVRDLDVKFTLRGQTLHAVRGASLGRVRGREPGHRRRVRLGQERVRQDLHGASGRQRLYLRRADLYNGQT